MVERKLTQRKQLTDAEGGTYANHNWLVPELQSSESGTGPGESNPCNDCKTIGGDVCQYLLSF